ncbi:outer membrane protein [Allorhizobium borbori]|uniref:Opacity protein-like surface antigen n=1 Tax=Allorhizobium borbori TaxID=485907 RepID=A0A7W6P026_9HYPH|nr:outer membrane protein [Allorhizobium borbori]MBB4102008.1 opacity protein-like surface antigen [Allorhizobium borbori]
MKSSVVGFVAALSACTSAFAADLYQPAPPVLNAPEVVVNDASGWYLRGDVGYSFNKLRGANFFQGSNSLVTDFTTASLKDSFIVGAGVGYQINSYLRSDLTFDYLGKSDFNGSTKGGGAAFGACVGPCTSSDRSSMNAYSLMANAYVDLGTYGGFTPYVGAGLGGSYVKWDKLRNTACADDGSGCDPTQEHGGKGGWRFTYALMAGASYDLTCNIKADAGYRFRHIEGGDMFGYKANGGPGYDKGINSHELRIGARYVFNGCSAQPYEPPMIAPPPVYK